MSFTLWITVICLFVDSLSCCNRCNREVVQQHTHYKVSYINNEGKYCLIYISSVFLLKYHITIM